jgi:hypothetical protein
MASSDKFAKASNSVRCRAVRRLEPAFFIRPPFMSGRFSSTDDPADLIVRLLPRVDDKDRNPSDLPDRLPPLLVGKGIGARKCVGVVEYQARRVEA